jgi:hypothetical protein
MNVVETVKKLNVKKGGIVVEDAERALRGDAVCNYFEGEVHDFFGDTRPAKLIAEVVADYGDNVHAVFVDGRRVSGTTPRGLPTRVLYIVA